MPRPPTELALLLFLALAACDGGDPAKDAGPADADADTDSDTDTFAGVHRATPTHGGGVVLTADATVAVVANRSAGEITVVDLDLGGYPASGGVRATFDVGDDEPWAAVLSGDDAEAWVVLREAREVVRIEDPTGAPALDPVRVATDAEPSALALSPNGRWLYVANFGAGTVSVIDPTTRASHAVDLNAALVASGSLGSAVATARPGLAHPMAIVVTDDGDDDDLDETVYVTEFFSQLDPAVPYADEGWFDLGRRGLVYAFDIATETVRTIPLAASADLGIPGPNGEVVACHPNQLYAAALDGERLYVAGQCASPGGNPYGGADPSAAFKTKSTWALYVIDTTSDSERADERLLLNALWQQRYEDAGRPDDATRRYPLIPNAIGFAPGTHVLYLTAYGADAVFRVELDGNGGLVRVGSLFTDFVDLGGAIVPGPLPYGLALTDEDNVVVVNEHTRNLSVIDLTTHLVEATISSASPVDPADAESNDGRRWFVTGLERWSWQGQAWSSCESCHPSGWSDGTTWFTWNGPRQTPSLAGTFAPDGAQRVLNANAFFDEISDFEAWVRGMSGGAGAIAWKVGTPVSADDRIVIDGGPVFGNQIATDTLEAALNGTSAEVITVGRPGHDRLGNPVFAKSAVDHWLAVEAWIATVRAPRAPALDPASVVAGGNLFAAAGCGGCHGGPSFTISERFYTPSAATNDATTGTLSTDTYDRGTLPIGLNPPADLGNGTATLRGGGMIQCVLRDVGTFPPSGTDGVAPPEVIVAELREDMRTVGIGSSGFNPPSLLGVGASPPYFHAGNARTLEEVFDPTFDPHTQALYPPFAPTDAEVADLVAFLLSIDDASPAMPTSYGAIDTVICP